MGNTINEDHAPVRSDRNADHNCNHAAEPAQKKMFQAIGDLVETNKMLYHMIEQSFTQINILCKKIDDMNSTKSLPAPLISKLGSPPVFSPPPLNNFNSPQYTPSVSESIPDFLQKEDVESVLSGLLSDCDSSEVITSHNPVISKVSLQSQPSATIAQPQPLQSQPSASTPAVTTFSKYKIEKWVENGFIEKLTIVSFRQKYRDEIPITNVKSIPIVGRNLAREIFFGERLLSLSTVNGKTGERALDQNTLAELKIVLKGLINERLISDIEFEGAFVKCINSFVHMCKTLRRDLTRNSLKEKAAQLQDSHI